MTAITIAFLLGGLAFGPAWLLYGAFIADSLTTRRHRRRRQQIDLYGTDAIEAWKTDIDWQQPTASNGTPFEGDEVA